MLKKLWKRLLCKHDYEYQYERKINGGMTKITFWECKKCGKIKIR